MARVFWDTHLFVYLIEGSAGPVDRVRQLRDRMRARGDELVTSTLTLAEVLVAPRSHDDAELHALFASVISSHATLVPFDRAAAARFAEIRASRHLKVADAVQLACAASAGVDLFITGDDRFDRLIVPGIQFITSIDRAFL